MKPSTRTLLWGLAATELCACGTVLGLDRFDGASLALDVEAGAPIEASSQVEVDAAQEGGDEGTGPDDAAFLSDTRAERADGANVEDAANSPDAADAADAAPAADASRDERDASTQTEAGDDVSMPEAAAEAGAETSDATDGAGAPLYSDTFDTSIQGWSVFYGTFGDAGGTSACSLTLSTTEGDPSPGSMELQAPFDGTGQDVIVGFSFPGAGADLAGRTLSMNIMLASGLASDGTGYAFPFAQDTNYNWADNGGVSLTPGGGWVTLTMSLDHPNGNLPAGYSSASIHNIGVEIGTPGNSTGCSPATIYIDTIVVQ
jgi:hypothetical protein